MFTPSTATVPYWGKSERTGSGRDHLGIQNASVAVYNKLIVGITNVTERVRYYGFYCWVLEQYQQQAELTNDPEQQHQFIRRAELLLAYLMFHFEPDSSGYAGKDYVRNSLKDGNERIDLAKGASKRKEYSKSYWQYNTGAFGQYFLGSLINLNLIAVRKIGRKSLHIRTDKGKTLADAYDQSIPKKEKQLFLKIVIDGNFSLIDLEKLPSFRLSEDLRNTQEWETYLQYFYLPDGAYGPDGDELTLRRRTIATLLSWLNEREDYYEGIWNDFPLGMYVIEGEFYSDKQNTAPIGWYYFYLNELVHYAIEAVFWAMLKKLDLHPGPYPFQLLIQDLTDAISSISDNQSLKEWAASNLDTKENEFLLWEKIDQQVYRPGKKTIDNAYLGQVIWDSILMLFFVYLCNEAKLEKTKRFAHSLGMIRPGAAPILLEELIAKKMDLPAKQLSREIMVWVINQHLKVALEKFQASGTNVLKVEYEEGYLNLIKIVGPTFTSPRLQNLAQFLLDLRIIEEDGQLTTEGKNYLKKLQS